jgi:hypothetical protein
MSLTFQPVKNIFRVWHKKYDKLQDISTLVQADCPEDAMQKLNNYLATAPHGKLTAMPCKGLYDVSEITVLS